MTGRTLVIGDIHGCDTALETLLLRLQPASRDCLIVLGDVVDRGPNTSRCIEMLLDLQESCRLVFLMGNHEEMMLEALREGKGIPGWLSYGGLQTLESYGGESRIPAAHLDFLSRTVDYHRSRSAICIHANLQPEVPLEKQSPTWLRWVHLSGSEQPHPSGKLVVCGHTRLAEGVPAVLEGWVCIDTAACAGGYLSCLDLDKLTVVQSNQEGALREEVPLSECARPFSPHAA